ncbi:MAG: ROK family transcriptional regulator [Hamadaea sp.]|uniref:ROK family transcriptional regulator n=1 Tax=Hamadaea sp. TaxID=2024425 RepID=UPI0018575411|nr:ROK family transcriptional regulator [Hamadaea sp.]NUR73439.1 ROK family transcriptional regulator [Hamadaea sp.]NUT23799.1 ROK family transcriptional regulator [Hamadaea sp.]
MVSATSGPRLRDVNRTAILALVGRHGPISRADIARRLGLSPPTVTAVTRSFIEAGVLHKVDDDASRGGRPGELLAVAGSAASAIGVKVAAGHVTGVHADLDGTVLDTFSAPVDALKANPFDALAELLTPRIPQGDQPTFLGVGVGIPGFVDTGTGLVQAQLLGWKRMPLADYLSQLVGVPVLVDNDVNTLAAYEHLYGLGRPYEDFLTVTLGRGVGAAVFSGGDLRRGGHGAAGELGHLPVDPENGLPCHCGRRGCLETYLSDEALMKQAGTKTPEELKKRADQGDKEAQQVYAEAGRRLGLAVAGLSVVLDPQAILVSGEGSRAWPHLAVGFEPAFTNGVFPGFADRISVHVDPWDDAKWALGAAALVLRTPFTFNADPQADAVRSRLAAFSLEAGA